jgi:hypothetical protein
MTDREFIESNLYKIYDLLDQNFTFVNKPLELRYKGLLAAIESLMDDFLENRMNNNKFIKEELC